MRRPALRRALSLSLCLSLSLSLSLFLIVCLANLLQAVPKRFFLDVDGWTDGQRDGWTDGRMDGCLRGRKFREPLARISSLLTS